MHLYGSDLFEEPDRPPGVRHCFPRGVATLPSLEHHLAAESTLSCNQLTVLHHMFLGEFASTNLIPSRAARLPIGRSLRVQKQRYVRLLRSPTIAPYLTKDDVVMMRSNDLGIAAEVVVPKLLTVDTSTIARSPRFAREQLFAFRHEPSICMTWA
jgi:hypothetical protein